MLITLLSTSCLILLVLLIIQQRKNRLLQSDRQVFRALAENSPDLIFIYDRQGRRVYVNPVFTRLFGVLVEDIVGKSPADSPVLDSAQNRKLVDSIRHGFETGESSEIDVIFEDQQGLAHNYSMLLIPECDGEGQVNTVLGLNRDITAIREVERTVSNLVTQLPGFVFKFRRSADGFMSYPFASPRVEEFFGLRPEDIVQDATPLHAMTHPEDAPRVLESILESARTMSSSHVEYRLLRPGYPERWVEVTATPEAEADGGVLWYGFFLDITERKRAEQDLKQALESIDGIINAIPDLLFEFDLNGTYLNVWAHNPTLLVAQKEILLGNTVRDVLLPDDAEITMSAIDEADRKGSSFGKVIRIELPQGTSWFELSVSRKPGSSDTDRRFIALSRDITERRRMELLLATRERELRTLLESIPDNIARYTPDARRIYINPVLERTYDKPKEYFLGRTPMECFPDGRYCEYQRRVIATAATGSNYEMEMAMPMANGEVEYHFIRFVPERNEKDEVISVLAIGTDITERKRAELALAAREREFRSLAESLPDNIIRYDRKGVTVYVNPVLERTLGESATAMIGATPREHHPDGSYEDYAQLLDVVLASGEAGELEKQHLDQNGGEHLSQIRMVPEFDDDGEVVGVLAIGRDITETRRAEEKLRLAASVFTSTSEGIIVSDTDNRILDVNEAFTRITGYTREEVIGENPSLLSYGRQAPEFYAEMWRTLQQTGHWAGEIWNQRSDGEEYAVWLTISVVNDDQGKLSHYVAVFADITLIKEQERQLQRIAHHDALTGLPNRLLFLDRLKQAVAQARRSGGLLAVCYGDLDGFKPVNDRYGHEAGDNVLVTIGKRMQECVRVGDTVGRIGGDEFVILLMDLEGVEECRMVLTRLLNTIAQPIQLGGHSVSVSASLGVALFPQDDADPDLLLRHADQAMYQAKRGGKSSYRLFDPDQP